MAVSTKKPKGKREGGGDNDYSAFYASGKAFAGPKKGTLLYVTGRDHKELVAERAASEGKLTPDLQTLYLSLEKRVPIEIPASKPKN
jgi:hypothetical protein